MTYSVAQWIIFEHFTVINNHFYIQQCRYKYLELLSRHYENKSECLNFYLSRALFVFIFESDSVFNKPVRLYTDGCWADTWCVCIWCDTWCVGVAAMAEPAKTMLVNVANKTDVTFFMMFSLLNHSNVGMDSIEIYWDLLMKK